MRPITDDTSTGLLTATAAHGTGPDPAGVPWHARLHARLRAADLDRTVAVGAHAPARSALAAHLARLTSRAEREAVAAALWRIRHDADAGATFRGSRIPLHRSNIYTAAEAIDAVIERLESPRPVGARGVAHLRVLLADGAGPLYRHGRGDLVGRLGAALAAL